MDRKKKKNKKLSEHSGHVKSQKLQRMASRVAHTPNLISLHFYWWKYIYFFFWVEIYRATSTHTQKKKKKRKKKPIVASSPFYSAFRMGRSGDQWCTSNRVVGHIPLVDNVVHPKWNNLSPFQLHLAIKVDRMSIKCYGDRMQISTYGEVGPAALQFISFDIINHQLETSVLL